MNLLKETKGVLAEHKKTVSDILWVGCASFQIPIDDFLRLADTEYNAGFGAQEVAYDLVIVVNGGWLERGEYDGSEHWDYKEMLDMPQTVIIPTALTIHQARKNNQDISCGWEGLSALNGLKI
jgi:hypothetical protein